jgi:hypothetical protein
MAISKSNDPLVLAAKCWLLILGDQAEARNCLEAAEALTSDRPFIPYDIAEAWMALFGDAVRARRLLQHNDAIEEKSQNIRSQQHGFGFSAEKWVSLLDDDRAARRCLERAEAAGLADRTERSDNFDTVGHFPTLTSCSIWDQGGEF